MAETAKDRTGARIMTQRLVILYRGSEFEKDELPEASKHFFCTNSRMDIREGDLVLARYSALPFFEELCRDMERIGARLLNSYRDHQYIADLREWYGDLWEGDGHNLQRETFRTWFSLEEFNRAMAAEPALKVGSFVLKGATNSKKFNWSSSMWAQTWEQVLPIYFRLQEDGLVGSQPIYIRQYVPLQLLGESIGDAPPVSKEYRFFAVRGQILCGAFYWSSYEDDVAVPPVSEVPMVWLQQIAALLAHRTTAVCIDVAETQDGAWKVVELNDLQMSGLSCNPPAVFYQRLYEVLAGSLDAI